jgi:hypothetical protein
MARLISLFLQSVFSELRVTLSERKKSGVSVEVTESLDRRCMVVAAYAA